MSLNEKIYKRNAFINKTKTLMGWMLLFYSSKQGTGYKHIQSCAL